MLVTLGGQRELKVLTTNARENVGDQVVIGLSFASEWLREWWKFFFLTNHRAKKIKTSATPDNSRPSIINCYKEGKSR